MDQSHTANDGDLSSLGQGHLARGGQSIVASAAYRSAERLHDQRLDQGFDYRAKLGVEHVEILAPEGAPAWVIDRQALWNAVEAVERRKDAQLAREIEVALPVELDLTPQIELVRAFAKEAFVAKGMVVDLAIHTDNPENPHAHLLLTTREITAAGFGAKRRDWNSKEQLLEWRERWAALTNEHLRQAGIEVSIDHRSLADQGIDLLPGRKIGISRERQETEDLPPNLKERVQQQREIAAENGRRILGIRKSPSPPSPTTRPPSRNGMSRSTCTAGPTDLSNSNPRCSR